MVLSLRLGGGLVMVIGLLYFLRLQVCQLWQNIYQYNNTIHGYKKSRYIITLLNNFVCSDMVKRTYYPACVLILVNGANTSYIMVLDVKHKI